MDADYSFYVTSIATFALTLGYIISVIGVVHKLRLQNEVCIGGPKMSIFCQPSYHRKCQLRGVGGIKSQNLVNLVCERPFRFVRCYGD